MFTVMQQLTKKQKLTLALNKKQDEDLSEGIKPYDKRNPNYIEVNDWVFFNGKVG